MTLFYIIVSILVAILLFLFIKMVILLWRIYSFAFEYKSLLEKGDENLC